jgi:hypothetical protein
MKTTSFFRTFFVLALSILFVQCGYTVTTKPDLSANGEQIIESIQNKYAAENIEITDTKESGQESNKLITIKLINGQQLPTESKLQETGGEIVTQVRNALQRPEDVGSYKVQFVTKKSGTSYSKSYTYLPK